MVDIKNYLNKRTLFLGDVNVGKTFKMLSILQEFVQAGYADDIAVLDLSPDPIKGVGGKIKIPDHMPIRYLTANIAAPRLMGQNADHTQQLAETNARVIETLFTTLVAQKKKILFVNDATLYFHAGAFTKFLSAINTALTQIINAYQGDRFEDSYLTRREKQLTVKLIESCDEVRYLS